MTAVPAASPWARRARFLAGVSQLALRQVRRSVCDVQGAGRRAADARRCSTTSASSQLRRGGHPQSGTAGLLLHKAAEADPGRSGLRSSTSGTRTGGEHDPQAAIYWLREAVRRNPADGDAHFVLGAALAGQGTPPRRARERELARRLSSTYEQWDKRPAADAVPKDLERVKNDVELPHAGVSDERVTATGQRDQAELATFYLDRGRRAVPAGQRSRGDRRAGSRALPVALSGRGAPAARPHLILRNGQTREAIDALKISLWSAETRRRRMPCSARRTAGEGLTAGARRGRARARARSVVGGGPGAARARWPLTC